MMTKQDFIALADALRVERPGINWDINKAVQWELDCKAVADVCQQSNSRFNRSRWYGYIKGECGPNGGEIRRARVTTAGTGKRGKAKK